MSSRPIVVIADDLSGAAELGAIGLRSGLRAEIILRGEIGLDADLVCLDTNSRLLGSVEAAECARAAAEMATRAQPRWIYKKVDSVLRGNIVVEVEALMRSMSLPLTLLVPVNPSLGRVIRDGRYFVHGAPVDETEFARDPAYPRTSSFVRKLLGTSGSLPLQICKLDNPLPTSGIAVGEAQTIDDLRAWAARIKPGMLAAGTAEFFGALLARETPSTAPKIDARTETGAELFVCGSTSESSRAFIQEERERGTPVFSLPIELSQGAELKEATAVAIASEVEAALHKQPRAILCIRLPLVQEPNIAQSLAGHLVNVAARIVRNGCAGRVYAEGGATAMALVREMNWERFTVLRELALGVATVAVNTERSIEFTLKPGSYVWPDEIRKGRS